MALEDGWVECGDRIWRVRGAGRRPPRGVRPVHGSQWMILSRDFVKLVVKCVGPEQLGDEILDGRRSGRNECLGMRAWDAYARQTLIPDEVLTGGVLVEAAAQRFISTDT